MKSNPARRFPYFNARVKENTTGQDCGASIRDVAVAISEEGFPDETLCPFDPSLITVKPSDEAYGAAKIEIGCKFMWLDQTGPALVAALKTAIAAKDPIMCGIVVYESFESDQVAKTGRVPVPHYWEQQLGGHAIALIGWNDHIQCFEGRNSWGAGWGDHGYFWLPYAYVTNQALASDFASLQLVP